MGLQLIKNKKHMVIKRDGRIEEFNPDKLEKVIMWACDNKKVFTDEIFKNLSLKIYDKIKIDTLYNETINTAMNLISDLTPAYDTIAKKLYLLKLHKQAGSKLLRYPKFSEYIKKLYSGEKLQELPQFAYLRIAISLMRNDGIKAIKEKYDYLSMHKVIEATPKMVNSTLLDMEVKKFVLDNLEELDSIVEPERDMLFSFGGLSIFVDKYTYKPNSMHRKFFQAFSCCLARPEDDIDSINLTAHLLSRESKYGGGLATDFSAIRGYGSNVDGNGGFSSGAVPFIQEYQWTIGAYNQGGVRSSALSAYYNWFHIDSPAITMLKDEGGKDEDRARKLKYAIKWNKVLSDALIKDEHIYIINPHKTQDLTFAWGEDFREKYERYCKNSHVKKKKVKARDYISSVLKIKGETGNNYTFFVDNANIQNIGSADITQSNLCMEYMPNFKPIVVSKTECGNIKIDGDIALCNLASINLILWVESSPIEKDKLAYNLLRSADNAIDVAFYANEQGRRHSIVHRNIGIGTFNYAYLLAKMNLHWNNKEARKLTHTIYEEISFYLIKASIQLAKEKSRFELFDKSKWSKGIFPHELSILSKQYRDDLNFELNMDWDSLREDLVKYGIRNEYIAAIAPNATSAYAIGATGGVEPVKKTHFIASGTYDVPYSVPEGLKLKEYYDRAFFINNKDIIELAAIRQKFIDMGQSVSLYYKELNSMSEMLKDILYAEKLGLKSLYYTNTPKSDEDIKEDECLFCQG